MSEFEGFLNFIREQGVVGLAVGFILGGAVSKLVSSLVTDIINPLLGLFLGKVEALSDAYIVLGDAKLMWGHFLNVLIDFIVISMVVYYGVKGLGIHKLDKPKK